MIEVVLSIKTTDWLDCTAESDGGSKSRNEGAVLEDRLTARYRKIEGVYPRVWVLGGLCKSS